MGFKKRMGVIVKSQVNDWVSRAEDPEKILNQAVEDMEEGLEKATAKIAVLKSKVEDEEKLLNTTREQIKFWTDRAERCVKQGMDENAKEAVRKKRLLEVEERKLSLRHTDSKKRVDEFEERFAQLNRRVESAKSKRNILINDISLKRDTVTQSQNSGLDNVITPDDPFSVFKKMEQRVESQRGLSLLERDLNKEEWIREEKLIDEEIRNIKKNISKGGSKK